MAMYFLTSSPSTLVLVLFIILFSLPSLTEQLQTSYYARTLLKIKKLLNSPSVLSKWNSNTDFCNIEPTLSLTVVCYEDSITQLHINGDNEGGNRVAPLPGNFSIDSFFTTLVRLPTLKVLSLVSLGLWGSLPGKISRLSSLEILNVSSNYLNGVAPDEVSLLRNLQTLILDNNMFNGEVPDWMGEFPRLAVLSLRNNSFVGSLPNSFSTLETLRVLGLSMNKLSGEVPDLSSLTHLQVLDLQDNGFGPEFPILSSNLISLVLKKNKFHSAIPDELGSYYQLERLDVSLNRFIGPFPKSLISLPSITYLNMAENKLTGMLLENMSCNAQLSFVDLSSNLLTGDLPSCLVTDSNKNKVVHYSSNCLSTTSNDPSQHPIFFCRNEALAVGVFSNKENKPRRNLKTVLASIILGGILGGVILVILILVLVKKVYSKEKAKKPQTRFIKENVSTGYTAKLLSDARYISQTMKLGGLGLPSYRTFSLEELEAATNNFNTSTFLGEGSHGQMYKGTLKDDSIVAIRCLKLKRSHSTQSFVHHIELISKLRHCHLVSALGHCFECYLDDSSVSRIFLVFEYVSNGTLRGCITGQTPTWIQRIAIAIGVAKGIQYLHTGIVPGVFSNNLKITDVLLDQNLVAKISSYNLPLLTENMRKVGTRISYGGPRDVTPSSRTVHEGKVDIYDFGVILLEILVGMPIISKSDIDVLKDQLRLSLLTDGCLRRAIVVKIIRDTCFDESLRTVMEICHKCISNEPLERPSIEDVLWNLQFAAQVQEEWMGESSSSRQSPISTSPLTSMHLIV